MRLLGLHAKRLRWVEQELGEGLMKQSVQFFRAAGRAAYNRSTQIYQNVAHPGHTFRSPQLLARLPKQQKRQNRTNSGGCKYAENRTDPGSPAFRIVRARFPQAARIGARQVVRKRFRIECGVAQSQIGQRLGD